MNVKECYEAFGGDYEGVTARMPGDAFVAEFLQIFLEDESYPALKTAMEQGEPGDAFRAVHSLKGICQNFDYTSLYKASCVLTELLRGGTMKEGAETAFQAVTKEYERMTAAIEELDKDI